MKFTSEDLMKAMGLAVGDTIKLNGKTHTFTTKKDGTLICKNVLKQLIDQDFEILPKIKRVGDLKCGDFDDCSKCPLRTICELILFTGGDINFYEILEKYKKSDKRSFDQEIYELVKKRLDKEVVEE